MLFETSFEDWVPETIEFGEVQGKNLDRGGNIRVNMPDHPDSRVLYYPDDVHRGLKSIHCWGEKAWRWGYEAKPRLPYGEIDVLTGQWLSPTTLGRPLEWTYDLVYNHPGFHDAIIIPDARIQDIATGLSGNGIVYGNYYWERSWINHVDGAYVWNNWTNPRPRSRIVIDTIGSLPVSYQRVYFKIKQMLGCSMTLMRWYATNYVCNIDLSLGNVRSTVYGNAGNTISEITVTIPGGGLKLNQWYYFEGQYVHGSPGGSRIWLSEEGQSPILLLDGMVVDTSASLIPFNFQVGIIDTFDQVWDASSAEATYAALDIYVDDWAIDANPIGTSEAIKHTLTVNSVDKYGSPIMGIPFNIRRV